MTVFTVLVLTLFIIFAMIPLLGYVSVVSYDRWKGEKNYGSYLAIGTIIILFIGITYGIFVAIGQYYLFLTV